MCSSAMVTPYVLMTGSTGFLGSHFLYRVLQRREPVVAIVRGSDASHAHARLLASLEAAASSYYRPLDVELNEPSLLVVPGDITLPMLGVNEQKRHALNGHIDELWHFAASLQFEARRSEQIYAQNVEGTSNALELALVLGVRRFVYISTAYTAGRQTGVVGEAAVPDGVAHNNAYERTKAEAERMVARTCERSGIDYRILRPSIIVGPAETKRTGGTQTGIYGFVRELRRMQRLLARAEITINADPEAPVNLIAVDAVVRDMLTLRAQGFPAGPYYHLVNDRPLTVSQLVPIVCDVARINRLALNEAHIPSTPIERLFDRRMEFYRSYLFGSKKFVRTLPPAVHIGPADVRTYLQQSLMEKEGRTVDGLMERGRLVTEDGCTLAAFKAGKEPEPTVVLVNAFGMPAEIFVPLTNDLRTSCRVLTWETRGVPGGGECLTREQAGLSAHVRDLRQLLRFYGVEGRVHVVGWCSGAHIAHRFAREFPALTASVVLLNGTYFMADAPLTAFQQNMRLMMPRIAKSFASAELFHRIGYASRSRNAAEAEQIDHLLDGIPSELIPLTSLPFQTPESLYRYALMISEVLCDGEERHAGCIKSPCLVFAGKRDQVAHYEGALSFVARAQPTKFVVQEDGDHYAVFFDRSVARVVESFVREHAGA